MSSYTPNLQLFKYNTSTDGKEVFSIEQALNHNWDILDQNSGSRNIGEIVASTIPLTDAGLHLLDGSLLQYGSYKAFIDYIAGLVSSYPDLFVSESDWQDSITSYGVCGKFVYDSENNTVRLPKITGIIEGTVDVSALGDLVEAGLPNITGNIGITKTEGYNTLYNSFGALYDNGSQAGGVGQNNLAGGDWISNIGFDASRSNSIYGNSTTVQPQTIKVLYYIVIATSAKTQIQVDIDEIATDLNNKLDRDLTNVSNISASFKSEVIDWWIPDYDSVINLGSSVTNYTAPSDGYLYFNLDSYSSNVIVNGNSVYVSGNDSGNEGCVTLIVKAGDVINIPGHQACCFIPRERS